jgi:predicted regulator of Ras-like GTPase activity (Roadblock/LC7/MglB family)
MRSTQAVEAWTIVPLERFVGASGARLVMIMTPAGQVMAQYGFARAVDVMTAAALGAGIIASTGEIASLLGQEPFHALGHRGRDHGIFLSSLDAPRGRLLVLVVYGAETSLGLVQLFFANLAADLIAACPEPEARGPVLAENFESELNRSLDAMFGS